MFRKLILIGCLSVVSACGAKPPGGDTSAGAEAQYADFVFHAGAILTATPEAAEAIAVRGGEIVYVGTNAGLAPHLGPDTEQIAIGDGLLMPGFIDAHIHPDGVGLGLTIQCDISGIGDADRILAAIEACADQRQGEAWLVGRGWALGAFEDAKPSALALDAILPPDMAAYLTAEDGHNAWANSLAFERAGIGAATPDPEGGHIERLANGEPQGTLREYAMDLFQPVLPEITRAQQIEALSAAMALFNRYGITTIVDASVDAESIAHYRTLRAAGALTTRSLLAVWVDPGWDADFDQIAAVYDVGDPLLRVSQIKLMLDGVMENQTAHLSFPYPGLHHHGTRFFEDEAQLIEWATRFEDIGYQLHFHTVGDAAITEGLRILEASRRTRGASNNRPVFAHDYLVDPRDGPRLLKADAYMQMTMLWDQQNDSMVDLNKPFLTDRQYAALMPADELLAAGIPVIGGSDAPVGQANPLASIQVAVTGQGVPYFDGGDMAQQPPMPGGRVDVETMLLAYTRLAAEALAMDDLVGTIDLGKRADLVLLARNPLTVDSADIYGIPVAMTLMDGQAVYRQAID